MKKRVITLLLLLTLVCNLLPQTSLIVHAETGIEVRINEILSTFPAGSFFTVNGNSCTHSSGSTCSNCYVRNVLASRGLSFSSNYSDGWTCYGFATFCFGYIFGQNFMNASGVISSGNVSNGAGFYAAFQYAKKGDFVYHWKTGHSDPGHYSIFLDCDANGVWLLHANTGGGVNKISTSYISYNSLFSNWGHNRVDIYRATNYDDVCGVTYYNPQGVTDEISGGEECVYIRGWAFDRDDLSQSLELHVYVGGPAGSASAIGYGGIIANAYRPDVNDSYSGVGNYHGFSAAIPTTKRGEQPVYVYAINTGGGENVEIGHGIVIITEDTAEYYIDLNGLIDGVEVSSIATYGTADIYANDIPVADDVSDFYSTYRSGTRYEFKDIQPLPGYSYDGIASGSRKGTIDHANVEVRLAFSTIDPSSVTETPVEVEYNDHLYLYYPNTKVTWYAAKEICESFGGHLITITSEEENQFATSLINGNGHAWIGATDVRDEDNWKWITGETFDYAPWCPGEPNNSPPDDAGMDSQDYGVLYDGYGQWDDAAGTAKLGFICEIDTICDHSYIYEVSADPTETTAGLITGTCEYCDNTVEIMLPALNKTDYSFSVLEEPTCQATGTGRYTWKNTTFGEFSFDVTLEKTDHTYEDTVTPATCTQYSMKVYTCSVCGDSYSIPIDPEYSEWSGEYPSDVRENLIESRTEYRYQDKETTASNSDYLQGWTLYDTTTSWSDYGDWSEWQFDPVTSDDYTMVDTQTVYPYYFFYCTTCGTGARYPYYGGTCEICGNATIPSSTGTVVWYTSPWSNSTQWGSTSKYYQYIDGGIVWNWTEGSAQTQYKYCTRSLVYTYHHYRWTDWSEWGPTAYSANDNRNVESRTAYRYVIGPFGEHLWDAGTITKDASCTEEGVKTFTCSVCGETKAEAIEKLGHDLAHHIAQAPTCTKVGWDAYDTCSRCDYTTYVEKAALGHEYKAVVTAPTCTAGGYTTYTCSRCADSYLDSYVDALGHDYGLTGWQWTGYTAAKATFTCKNDSSHVQTVNAMITNNRTEPTCEAAGKVVYTAKVTFEGKDYTDTKTQTLDALDHSWNTPTYTWAADNSTVTAIRTCKNDASHVETETVNTTSEVTTPATCTAKGKTTYTATFTNSAFATQTKTVTNVPALGHTPAAAVKENETTATCTVAGGYDMVVYCSVCSAELSREHTTLDAIGHDYELTGWAWTGFTAASATFTCKNDASHVEMVDATITSVRTEPTAEQSGSVVYTAKVTFEESEYTDTKTDILPALGHDYELSGWNWTGYTAAAATFTDKNGGDPITVNATITSERTEPTCTEEGRVVYTATVTFEGKDYTDAKTETLDALDHDWNKPEYIWADNYSTVTATRTCKNDANHKETETVNTTSEVTKPATYDEEGEIVYTATFENEAFATQTKAVATPKLEKPDDPTPGLPCDGGDNCPGNVFTDMPTKGNWAHDAIDWAIVTGVTSGTSETTFSPNAGCTRAQVVTFLWRAAGSPEPTSTNNPFTDVKEGTYYYKAVLWAIENKVTAGTSATTFSPDATCTRAQIVTFLWRFEGSPAPKTTNNPFTDVKPGSYYEKAVLWASETGVTAGTSATAFSPDATCTRAQVVTFLYRDIEN